MAKFGVLPFHIIQLPLSTLWSRGLDMPVRGHIRRSFLMKLQWSSRWATMRRRVEEVRGHSRTWRIKYIFYIWASWCDDVNPSTLFKAWKKILSAVVEQHDSEELEPKDYHWTCRRPGRILQWRICKCGWMVMTIQTTGVWLDRRLLILLWELPQVFKELYFSFDDFLNVTSTTEFFLCVLDSWFLGNPYCPPTLHIVHMSEGLLYCIHICY